MIRRILLSMSVCVAAMSAVSFGQQPAEQAQPAQPAEGGGRGEGRRGGGPGGGNWNPEEMRNRMMDRFKEETKTSDEEWGVIRPKLEKVMAAQRDVRGGLFGGGGFGGGGGGGFRRDGGNNNEPQSEVQKASRDLRTTLQNENASADEINAKLKAFREARAKAEEALKAAREDLKSVLNERQEAVFVMASILE